MSRYSFLVFIIVSIFLISCKGEPQPREEFQQEDLYYMSAIDSYENREYESAANYYMTLYEGTENKEYLFGYLDSLISLKKYKEVEKKTREILLKENNHLMLRYLVLSLYKQGKDKEAIENGEKLLKDKKDLEYKDYIMLADLYLKNKQYEKSLQNYKNGYTLKNDVIFADKIAFILFEKLDRKQEGISFLETHIRLNECDLYLCGQLANYYLKVGDVESIIEVYKKMYHNTKDSLIGKKIVELYVLRKNYAGLAQFLEETNFDDKMLFEIYKIDKDYKNMSRISKKLYEDTMDVQYLAQHAMFDFEYAKKKTKKLIHTTVQKLTEVVQSNKNPIYLNYLGYLLIDYDIDVKQGVEYVKMALALDKDNIYYQDSLAWGEYKLKKYQIAYDIMVNVNKDIGSDETVMEHFKIIKNKCKKSKGCKVK